MRPSSWHREQSPLLEQPTQAMKSKSVATDSNRIDLGLNFAALLPKCLRLMMYQNWRSLHSCSILFRVHIFAPSPRSRKTHRAACHVRRSEEHTSELQSPC